MTNWEMMKAAIDDEIDDGGASWEATIYYNISCPYFAGNLEAKCHGGKDSSRELCVECKAEWLDKEYE